MLTIGLIKGSVNHRVILNSVNHRVILNSVKLRVNEGRIPPTNPSFKEEILCYCYVNTFGA